MVDSKHLSFPQLLFFVLLLFKFLQLKMAAQPSYNNDLTLILEDAVVRLRLERAFLEVFNLSLPSLHCDPMLFLLQFLLQVLREFISTGVA